MLRITPKNLLILPAVISYWGIENPLHWVLDVALKEDNCRIRKDNARQNKDNATDRSQSFG
jgi:predicted transposase YbfD/YdcC